MSVLLISLKQRHLKTLMISELMMDKKNLRSESKPVCIIVSFENLSSLTVTTRTYTISGIIGTHHSKAPEASSDLWDVAARIVPALDGTGRGAGRWQLIVFIGWCRTWRQSRRFMMAHQLSRERRRSNSCGLGRRRQTDWLHLNDRGRRRGCKSHGVQTVAEQTSGQEG